MLVISGNKISKYHTPLENLTSGPFSASQTGNSENSLRDLLLVISPNVLSCLSKWTLYQHINQVLWGIQALKNKTEYVFSFILWEIPDKNQFVDRSQVANIFPIMSKK